MRRNAKKLAGKSINFAKWCEPSGQNKAGFFTPNQLQVSLRSWRVGGTGNDGQNQLRLRRNNKVSLIILPHACIITLTHVHTHYRYVRYVVFTRCKPLSFPASQWHKPCNYEPWSPCKLPQCGASGFQKKTFVISLQLENWAVFKSLPSYSFIIMTDLCKAFVGLSRLKFLLSRE